VAVIPLVPPPIHSPDEDLEWVSGRLIPSGEVWLAEREAELVGVLVLSPGWVEQLYVAPGRTRAGIGSQLVRFAQQRQPAGLQLWTFQSNDPARLFYARHGFVEVEQTDGSGNEERQPDVRLVWPGSPRPEPQVASLPR
jgi:GNAT superfamily N-acetyltransferase